MRWQMSLYKEMSGKAEDAEDPEKVVKRVQEVSAVLYHIEVVRRRTHARTHTRTVHTLPRPHTHTRTSLFLLPSVTVTAVYSPLARRSTRISPRRWSGTSCYRSRDAGQWWPASG